MKRINLLGVSLLALSAVFFTGCDSDDPVPPPDEPIVIEKEQQTQTVFADETTGKSGVTFVTTGAWTSSITDETLKSARTRAEAPTWISISPNHGNAAGEYTISIAVEPNLTGSDRTATIHIECDGTETTISVTQKATKEDGKTILKNVDFEVLRCNPRWTPQGEPYFVADGAVIAIYNGTEKVSEVTTDNNGLARAELLPGDYTYTVTLGEEKNVRYDGLVWGVCGGIFISQAEIDALAPQSACKPGDIKPADLNGDGILDERDVAIDKKAPLSVGEDGELTVYIASDDFLTVHRFFNDLPGTMADQLRRAWELSYVLDASITRQASISGLQAIYNFGFNPSHSLLWSLWSSLYRCIEYANVQINNIDIFLEVTSHEKEPFVAQARYYRMHAYALLLNYFGAVPLIITDMHEENMPRDPADEVVDFISIEADEIHQHSHGVNQRYAALQVKARALMNRANPDYAGAKAVLKQIIDSMHFGLPGNPESWGGDAIDYDAFRANGPLLKGDGPAYPVRFTETLLLYAEALLFLEGNHPMVYETINQLLEWQGRPLLMPGDMVEARAAIADLWVTLLDREGHEYARLRRTKTFLPTLGQYGAQEKHLLMPIPQNAMDLNPNLTQNPGW